MDHNPHLQPWKIPTPNNVAGKGKIEDPAHMTNIVWQTRAAPPTAYENSLGDAFEAIFEQGAETPEQVVDALNRMGMRTSEGLEWTLSRFEAEMARLGA